MQKEHILPNPQRVQALQKYRLREAHACIAPARTGSTSPHGSLKTQNASGINKGIPIGPAIARLLEHATNRLDATFAAFRSGSSCFECIQGSRA
jgi:hypothetical protein